MKKRLLFLLPLLLLALLLFAGCQEEPSGDTQDRFSLSTDLVEGVVTEEKISFSLSLCYGDIPVTPEVSCNGILLSPTEEGRYTAALRLGENRLEIAATHAGKGFCQSYILTKATAFVLDTTLFDGMTVGEEQLSFPLSLYYGGQSVTVELCCNGQPVSGKNGLYTVSLNEGDNCFIVSGQWGDRQFSQQFVVKRGSSQGASEQDFACQTDIDEAKIVNGKLSFFMSASCKGEACSFLLTYNGKTLQASDGRYEVSLGTGENVFCLAARVGDAVKSWSWRISYATPELVTDLTDMDTMTKDQTFRAAARYDGTLCLVKLLHNQTVISPRNDRYALSLAQGDNTVVLSVEVGRYLWEYSYTLRYVDKPPTLSVGIEDGKSYRGSVFGFTLSAFDGLGKKLSADAISFAVDWTADDGHESFVPLTQGVSLVWDDKLESSFRLYFKRGSFALHQNTPFILQVTATDAVGRTAKSCYRMTYTPVAEGEPVGEVTFSLEGFSIGCGFFIRPVSVPVYEGVPFSQTLLELLDEAGYTYTYTGQVQAGFYLATVGGLSLEGNVIPEGIWDFVKDRGYVRSIAPTGRLGEFDFGSGSGWMYSVNGRYPNYGFADYYPQDGDVVRVQFTLILGEDLGGGGALGEGTGGSILTDDPDYAPVLKRLAEIAKLTEDKSVYEEVLNMVSEWDISDEKMAEALTKLQAAYGGVS